MYQLPELFGCQWMNFFKISQTGKRRHFKRLDKRRKPSTPQNYPFIFEKNPIQKREIVLRTNKIHFIFFHQRDLFCNMFIRK